MIDLKDEGENRMRIEVQFPFYKQSHLFSD